MSQAHLGESKEYRIDNIEQTDWRNDGFSFHGGHFGDQGEVDSASEDVDHASERVSYRLFNRPQRESNLRYTRPVGSPQFRTSASKLPMSYSKALPLGTR